MNTPLLESHPIALLSPLKEKQGSIWDVVLIESGLSKNGTFYPSEVLKKALPLFVDLKALAFRLGSSVQDMFDHAPSETNTGRFIENVIGWYEDVRFGEFKKPDGSKGEGIVAKLRILEGAEWLKKNLLDAWENGKGDLFGLSIDAEGLIQDAVIEGKQVKLVKEIEQVKSTDIVNNPAAGGRFTRLVASMGDYQMKEFLDLIKAGKPAMLDGFSEPAQGDDLKQYVMRVLESNQLRYENLIQNTEEKTEGQLVEQARGFAILAKAIKFLKAGNSEKALIVLGELMRTFSAPEQESKHNPEEDRLKKKRKGKAMTEKKVNDMVDEEQKQEIKADPVTEDEQKQEIKADPVTEENAEEKPVNVLEAKMQELEIRENRIKIREKLAFSNLPEKAKSRVFDLLKENADLDEAKIDAAITNEREYIASFSEGGKPSGLGEPEIKVTEDQSEKWDKGWDGLFGGGLTNTDGVHPFRSLKEAWGTITGKYCHPEEMTDYIFESIQLAFPRRANKYMDSHINKLRESWSSVPKSMELREAITTSDFSVSFGQALFRRLQKEYTDDPRNDWKKVVSSIENLSDATNTMSIVRIGGVAAMPTVNQLAPYQEVTDPTESTEVITPAKKGHLLKLSWEDVLADRLNVIRRIPIILGKSAVKTVHEVIWDLIDGNTALADGVALIAGAHANQMSGNPAISYGAITSAMELMRNQVEQDSGDKLGLRAKFLLTSPDKHVCV